MKKVLIATKPDDLHAILVSIALETKGHQCVMWYTGDFPEQQSLSFRIGENKLRWKAKGKNFNIDHDAFDVIWLRRPVKRMALDKIHEDDKPFALKEAAQLFDTVWRVTNQESWWVNYHENARKSNCKLLQLKLAKEAGLTIPETLMSNDVSEICQFIKKYKKVIYKTFYPMYWQEQTSLRLAYTTPISEEDITQNLTAHLVPGIYQALLPKKFELRVTYFGSFHVCVKLDSQIHDRGKEDWRYIPAEQLSVVPYDLPEEIDAMCQTIMRQSGLQFGCIDLIVTPDNDYYFLEINEAGQFLWIEQANPDIKMLDIFSEFLINGKDCFDGHDKKMNKPQLSMQAMMSKAMKKMRDNCQH